MTDYKEKFDRWTKKATEKLQAIDSQVGLKEKIEGGAKAVYDAAKTGADYVKTEAERSDIGRRAVKVTEDAVNIAGEAAKSAWRTSEPVRDVAADAGAKAGGVVIDTAEKAGDFVSGAADTVGTNTKRVARVVGFGSTVATTMEAGLRTATKAANWAKNDPVGAATTGVSMAVGAGLGIVFTGISSHWLMNSAIPTWSVKKLAERFDGYLKKPRAADRKRPAQRGRRRARQI